MNLGTVTTELGTTRTKLTDAKADLKMTQTDLDQAKSRATAQVTKIPRLAGELTTYRAGTGTMLTVWTAFVTTQQS